MKVLIFILTLLTLIIVVGSIFDQSGGSLIINFSDWTIQSSLLFAVLFIFFLFIIFYLTLRLLINLVKIPASISHWKKNKQQRTTEQNLTDGMVALLKGDWRRAMLRLTKGALHSPNPVIYYLAAAYAAHQMGKTEKQEEYLQLASGQDGDAEMVAQLVHAELQIQQGQTLPALAVLNDLHDQYPRQKRVLQLLFCITTKLKKWDAVLQLLPKMRHLRLISQKQFYEKQVEVYSSLFHQVDSGKLDNLWKEMPRKLRLDVPLITVYVQAKLKNSTASDCELLLRKIIKRGWDDRIIRLYGLVEGDALAKQLKFAESYLDRYPKNPSLLLTLGRLSMRNQLWGKAKSYLEGSLAIEPNIHTYQELAMVLESQQQNSAAIACYKEGVKLATSVEQDTSASALD